MKNDPLEKFPDLQGTYISTSNLPDSTKKPSWKSRVRDKQIWYDIENKRWAIGDAKDNFAYILGKTQDHFIMPCAESSWKYRNFKTGNFDTAFGYGQSGVANEIHIQCKGMLSNQRHWFSISIIFYIFKYVVNWWTKAQISSHVF